MSATRPPAVAGSFYPANPDELREQVARLLRAASARGPVPKAMIAPHAGYIYSGPIAANAYARIAPARGKIKRVALLGPSHQVALHGLAVPSVAYFDTPLGSVPIDSVTQAIAADLPQVTVADAPHAREHSLEVQLPFLQHLLGDFTLVPFSVGHASPPEVAEVLARLWGGPETLVVISSDLSHYYDYATAQRLDRATTQAIEALRYEALDYESACGRVPVCGLLHHARTSGLKAETLDVRNSGDTAGPREQVVGYGAYAFA